MSKAGRPSKFNYDSDEFYDEIFALAMQGATNAEIAFGLEDRFGHSLDDKAFLAMIHGRYQPWSEEENQRRGSRLRAVLARARQKINMIVRGRYLKTALGGIKTKNRSTTYRRLRVDGHLTDDEEIQTTESEIEYPPNMQALSTWLYHHDPDWRKVQRGEDVDEENQVDVGIDIGQWIDKELEEKNQR